jgi:hypothetical protein
LKPSHGCFFVAAIPSLLTTILLAAWSSTSALFIAVHCNRGRAAAHSLFNKTQRLAQQQASNTTADFIVIRYFAFMS